MLSYSVLKRFKRLPEEGLVPERNRCLVLGGCGFMGSNIVEALVAAGYQIRVFDTPTASRANLFSVASDIEFVEGDFAIANDVDGALENVEFVIHLIGTSLPAGSNVNPALDVESNVVRTIRLLEASVHHGVKRVLFASSGGTVYGEPHKIPIPEDHPTEPLCSYGITKLMIEKYLRLFHYLHGLDYTILRIANPYGKYQKLTSEQGAVGVFLSHIMDGKTITIWGDGSVTRDFIYVEDVANAFVKALTQQSPYRVFNIGSGVGLSLRELLSRMERITGIKPKVEYSAGRPIDVSTNVLDSTRANECMDWRAETDCETGLRKTWGWIASDRTHIAAVGGE